MSHPGPVLRVGIDGGALYRAESGIGRYTLEILRGLAAVAPDVRLSTLVNQFRSQPALPDLPASVRAVNPRIPQRLLRGAWSAAGFPPVETFLGDVDVYHVGDWVHPPLRRARMVATVHDLGPLEHPEWYAPDVVEHFEAIHRKVAENAHLILTVSAFTRDVLCRVLGVEPRRVRVVHSGVSPDFAPVDPRQARAVAQSVGAPPRFALFVGSRERRKNLLGLVEAFAHVARRHPDLHLVLVGARPRVEAQGVQGAHAWSGSEVEEAVASAGLEGRVHAPGMVPREDLPALYSAASVFVFPTLYEGFGFPGLEAMACGTPVVASDRTAVPEVLGDAAFLADPTDAEAFAHQVCRVLEDPGEAAALRERGLAWAADFTWEAAARRTVAAYREAAGL